MELPAEIKPDLHRTLLGPLSLATEMFGALLPGCVFVMLILTKRGWVSVSLSYPLLGYKTKVALALFVSYIVGKLMLSVIALIVRFVKWTKENINRKGRKQHPEQKPQNILQLLANLASQSLETSNELRFFIGGLVAAPIVSKDSDLFQHYAAAEASSLFHLNTGLAFIVAAVIPGDGALRLLEAAAGVILLVRGIMLEIESTFLVAAMLGASLNKYLSGLEPGQLSAGLKSGWSILNVLLKTQTPVVQQAVTPSPTPNSSAETGSAKEHERTVETSIPPNGEGRVKG